MKSTKTILRDLVEGKISQAEAEKQLKELSIGVIGDLARIDGAREERSGIPEVVFSESKNGEDLVAIAKSMIENSGYALMTRVSPEKLQTLQENLEEYTIDAKGAGQHYTVLASSEKWVPPEIKGKIAVMTAGTSDIPYAWEAILVAKVMGVDTISFFDVGVAGIHRLVEPIKKIVQEDVSAVVVLAGMEGALPTVVASLVNAPVIGVPIPTGYGHGGKGETALASMLQSCAPGLAVVNIGNGLGAGSFAALIARKCVK
ncbi:MAG: nickel pincer cofactor biosynthesis protein LarB [Candidatus Lokiarchaeota archaeon]|nr:nickel pincer cofactor biosynthesis protein LarB [Candidatus Lokiarchaeota archaeon]